MGFIKTAVKRRVTVAMIFLCVVLLGVVSLQKIGLDLFPAMEMPITMVMTSYNGAGSEEVEEMVTKPLESALGTVQGVDSIQSYSMANSSMVMVTFNWGTDLDFAGLNMREKIDMVKGMLPDDAGDPMVMKMDPNMMPIMIVGISGSNNLAELKNLVENDIVPALERQEGVASAELGGGFDQEVQVLVEPLTLESYGLTTQTIIQSIQKNNVNMAAGSVIDNNEDKTIRVLGKFKSLSDIENVNVNLPSGGTVLLKDIAKVKLVNKDGEYNVYQNGVPSVYLSISKQSDANTVLTAKNVVNTLESMKSELPPNVSTTMIFNQADLIQQTINSLVQSLLIGAILAIVILFLFLRSVRSTLVIAVSIPISLISTFVLMYFNGMTLNLMTLGGLALGTGMMVDSSIVILENIQRMRTGGMDGDEAAVKGASQLVMAVIASTLTTIAVFAPVVFMEGMTSMIFKDLALTVTFSLLASMVVAITLVPMLSARMLKPETNYEEKYDNTLGPKISKVQGGFVNLFEKVKRLYGRILKWALDHRKTVVLSITALFVLSFGLMAGIGMEFIPASDSGQVNVNLTLQDGAAKTETDAMAKQIEKITNATCGDQIQTTLVLVGGSTGGMGDISTNTGQLMLQLKPLKERDQSAAQIAEQIRQAVKDLPGVEISVEAGDMMSMGSSMGGGSSATVTIKGDSLDMLKAIGEQVKDTMEKIPGAREASSSLDEGLPELHLTINDNKVAALGLTVPQVASAVSGFMDGQKASTYTTETGNEIDIVVALPENKVDNIDNILNMQISTPSGIKLTLRDVVEVEEGQGPITISRADQTRQITVSCTLVDVDLNTFTTQLNKGLEDIVLPAGYQISQGGSYEEMTEAFSSLALALLLGLILIYMVMASLFESLSQPFIIMFSIPTTFIGVFLGLFLTRTTLNVTTFIGIIMLMGIVVNNGIVLVDYINGLRREEGKSCREALLEAGPVRLRPILMTALTTILAMIPMALSQAEGAEMSRGMAVAVAFGLTASTFFTLVLVPVIYSIFDDYSWRVKLRSIHHQAKLQAKITGRPLAVIEEELIAKKRMELHETGGLPPKKRNGLFGRKKRQEKKMLKKSQAVNTDHAEQENQAGVQKDNTEA